MKGRNKEIYSAKMMITLSLESVLHLSSLTWLEVTNEVNIILFVFSEAV